MAADRRAVRVEFGGGGEAGGEGVEDVSVDPEQMKLAELMVEKINAKVDALLRPLDREIQIMQWKPEYAAIVWEAVAGKAMKKAKDASNAS